MQRNCDYRTPKEMSYPQFTLVFATTQDYFSKIIEIEKKN